MDGAPIIVLVVIGGPILLVLIWAVANYNRMVALRQHIRESWADIDVEMKRRYDLVPNLVETVKGYAAHERQTFETVIAARNRAAANTGPADSQATDESTLMLALKRLFIVVEGYPQLRADANFLALQKELANTEDRIAAARRFFNANVRDLNRLCQSFPTNLLAGMFGIAPEGYFELSSEAERIVPRVAM